MLGYFRRRAAVGQTCVAPAVAVRARVAPVFAVLAWLALTGSVAVAAEQTVKDPTADGKKLPAPAGLDLFGHQSGADIALPESDREVKRPDAAAGAELKRPAAPASTAGGAERKVVERTGTRDVAAWRLRDMLPLGVVLGLIVAVGIVFKRFLPGRRLLAGGGAIEVLARSVISSKQSMVLVRLGRRLLLVGVSPEQLNTLCIVEDPEQVAGLLGEVASHQPNSISEAFRRSFAEEAEQYGEPPPEDAATAARGQIRGLLEKLRSYTSRHVA